MVWYMEVASTSDDIVVVFLHAFNFQIQDTDNFTCTEYEHNVLQYEYKKKLKCKQFLECLAPGPQAK